MRRCEDDLAAERRTASTNAHRITQLRYTPARLYAYHQGIEDDIAVYSGKHK
jgi:hypothetical protein